jgi:NADH-quinone oxidoreductase subunit J
MLSFPDPFTVMNITFYIAALLCLVSAVMALTLPNLVRAVLCLMASFIASAVVFATLGHEFLAMAQILVYVGAVGILMLFTLTLTRQVQADPILGSRGWAWGVLLGALLFGTLWAAVRDRFASAAPFPASSEASVKTLGESLMQAHYLPFEAVGLLLTVALIGAACIARSEHDASTRTAPAPH